MIASLVVAAALFGAPHHEGTPTEEVAHTAKPVIAGAAAGSAIGAAAGILAAFTLVGPPRLLDPSIAIAAVSVSGGLLVATAAATVVALAVCRAVCAEPPTWRTDVVAIIVAPLGAATGGVGAFLGLAAVFASNRGDDCPWACGSALVLAVPVVAVVGALSAAGLAVGAVYLASVVDD